MPRVLRDLSVLVAEVEVGTLVYKEDANYALLAGAAQTIKSILDRLSLSRFDQSRSTELPEEPSTQPSPEAECWNPWGNSNVQDFEANFWLTLAEHPFLIGNELAA